MKILIVEDEAIIAENLRQLLKQLGYEVCEYALGFDEAVTLLEREKPDLAILDIKLQGDKSGIDLAKYIESTKPIPFIFLTSFATESIIKQAKEVNPMAYLTKPFMRDELYGAIEIALSNFSKFRKAPTSKDGDVLNDYIFIKDKNIFYKIYIDKILYIKSDHIYLEVYTEERKYLIRNSMALFIGSLPNYIIQTHRSYAVNIKRVNKFTDDLLWIDNQEIPLSKSYKKEILKMLIS
jgi:DNA-binding LytR/AlgR family response regulator